MKRWILDFSWFHCNPVRDVVCRLWMDQGTLHGNECLWGKADGWFSCHTSCRGRLYVAAMGHHCMNKWSKQTNKTWIVIKEKSITEAQRKELVVSYKQVFLDDTIRLSVKLMNIISKHSILTWVLTWEDKGKCGKRKIVVLKPKWNA